MNTKKLSPGKVPAKRNIIERFSADADWNNEGTRLASHIARKLLDAGVTPAIVYDAVLYGLENSDQRILDAEKQA